MISMVNALIAGDKLLTALGDKAMFNGLRMNWWMGSSFSIGSIGGYSFGLGGMPMPSPEHRSSASGHASSRSFAPLRTQNPPNHGVKNTGGSFSRMVRHAR